MCSDWGGLDFFFFLTLKRRTVFIGDVLWISCDVRQFKTAFWMQLYVDHICLLFVFMLSIRMFVWSPLPPLFPLCGYHCFWVACHTFCTIFLFSSHFSRSLAVLWFPLLILSQQHNQNRIGNGEVGTGSVLPIGSSHPSLLPFCSIVLYWSFSTESSEPL